MRSSLFFVFLLFALVVLSVVCLASSSESLPPHTPERLVVVGDIHGDLDQALTVLKLANVVDPKGRWSGGSHTKLVQMGDLVDRGEQDKEVLDYFMALQSEAKAAGGEVVMLLGNHEIMNMMNDVRYVHPTSMKGFGGKDGHRKAWSREGVYGSWIREQFKLVHVYNKTLFVHAGLSASYARYGVDKLNIAARRALETNDFSNNIFGGDGPVWTRLLINKAEYGQCGMVTASLQKLGLDRMIVGHTPQRDLRVKAFCDASLIAVDVGISKFMYGGLAAVEITADPITGETILNEIGPNDLEDRSEKELNKLEEKGGVDVDMLQEMLQAVNEMEKAGQKQQVPAGGDNSNKRDEL